MAESLYNLDEILNNPEQPLAQRGGRAVNHDEGQEQSQIRAALRDAIGDAPLEGVDWDALQRRVMAAVQERDEVRPWWAVMAHWASVVVPVSTAASLVGILALARTPSTSAIDTEYSILQGAFGDSETRLEFLDAVLPAADAELSSTEEASN
jgi:hypothetical protein